MGSSAAGANAFSGEIEVEHSRPSVVDALVLAQHDEGGTGARLSLPTRDFAPLPAPVPSVLILIARRAAAAAAASGNLASEEAEVEEDNDGRHEEDEDEEESDENEEEETTEEEGSLG